jgi:dephospho-CoA kinase
MRVVATTGMPGSGKSLAIEVAEELGFAMVSMGDLVREETRERGLPADPESFGKVASEKREQQGPGAWAKPTADRVRELDAEGVLIDGLRNLEELEILREELETDVLVVALLASPATRYERLKKRDRAEDADNEDELHARDLRELGYGLGDVVAMADIYVDNERDPAETKATLRGVLGAEA